MARTPLLLGALLLSQLGGGAPATANAAPATVSAPNSALILKRTADGVERLEKSVRDIEKQLQSGAMRVMVTNLDEIDRGN